MKLLKIIFAFVFTLTTFCSNAQFEDGTVYLNPTEKINGVIKIKNSKEIFFKAKGKKLRTLSSKDVEYYEIHDKRFTKINISNNLGVTEEVFANKLVEGEIILLQVAGSNVSNALFIKKGKNSYLNLNNSNYVIELRKIMLDADNPGFIQKINSSIPFNKSNIINLIKEYSKLKNSAFISDLKRSKSNFGFGILAGLSSNQCVFKDYLPNEPYTPYTKNASIPFGIQILLYPSKSFSADLEINYHEYGGKRDIKYTSTTKSYTDKINIKSKGVSIPIHLKYSFKKHDLNPYLKLGVKYNLEPNFTAKLSRDGSPESNLYDTKRFSSLGYNCGVGIEKNISKGKNLRLEYRFSQQFVRSSSTKLGSVNMNQIFMNFVVFNN